MFPQKLVSGQKFKPVVVQRINDIIDYLRTQRIITDGKTIKMEQLSSGLAIHAIQQPTGAFSAGGGATFEHPFEMSIAEVENVGQVLNIRKGRISLNGDDESRIYVCFQPNTEGFLQYVSLPQTEGTYEVNVFCFYDENTQSANQDFWQIRVCYSSMATTRNFVQSSGMFHFLLGTIEVTEDENNQLSYEITSQVLTSGFAVYDDNINAPFKGYFSVSNYPSNGDTIQNMLPQYININGGAIYVENSALQVSATSLSYNGAGYVCVSLNYQQKTVTWTFNSSSFNYHTTSGNDDIYNFPIISVFVNGASPVGIKQHIFGDFVFAIQTFKVKNTALDNQPDYLNNKVAIQNKLINILDWDKTSSLITLKSNAGNVTGIVGIENGTYDIINAAQGDYVLGCINGRIQWIPFSTCEDACSASSVSSSSIGSL